jgi:hypothetical protein
MEDDEEVNMDALRFKIEGTGKQSSSAMKEILRQIESLDERLVPIEIIIPHTENIKLERIIQRVLHETPEYLPGKFILKTPQRRDKGTISGRIFSVLHGWNGGVSTQDPIMETDQNQFRAPDIEWRQVHPTDAQRNNSRFPIAMPDLWIEVCYNRSGDRNAAFEKIQYHVPSQSTVFVAIVLANNVSTAMRQRMGVIGMQAVPPTIAAPALTNIPRCGPYMAVWSLGNISPVYYNVRRGHYVDLQLVAHAPNPGPVFRFDMDLLICQLLQ